MYPYYYEGDYLRQQEKLVGDVLRAINGEYSAIQCYERIARLAPNEGIRRQINEIRKDEQRHYQEFVRIYTNLTGRQPNVKAAETCPATYRDGIDFAFRDEQETVDFYHQIAKEATSAEVKEAFRNAAADEQNHAVWFLFFMTAGR
ncbi:ferritin family protein [Bacillus sp. FJAT-27445]|uniref:ferritin family protein n=1 Tax=Bacillus sp. FJAT-27445 TaxID=1679166 RepID=UPI000743394D|nr:ferritin-like domain-containing protein [Bacillus sp. FJAT-27445]